MKTGLFFVILGIIVLLRPEVLIYMFSVLLITFGLGMMATAWQFRRMRRCSESKFVNWIVRY